MKTQAISIVPEFCENLELDDILNKIFPAIKLLVNDSN